jgi:hypothetical protein
VNKYVVDTNLLAIANNFQSNVNPVCKLAVIRLLKSILETGVVVIDDAGEITGEYRNYCNAKGQPNVGDEFFRQVLMNYSSGKVLRITLQKTASGGFEDFPTDPRLSDFDLSDRKFAAAGIATETPVYAATDSDWLDHLTALNENGLKVEFVCSPVRASWFQQ